ncbi:hypothetical protein CDD80_6186 [Ophiocordyceps camponoti-rufipedis]|uniref:Uncharacterized protein n=1 Tax=Ophiocordyceps camponoti-rufipedis TaxID=2004952 RepID=A0A2C5ZAC4_9HYPO|nr:hypothetical protein CDD80_6186 [Ophiocordyceps camponoti-rufipedis]
METAGSHHHCEPRLPDRSRVETPASAAAASTEIVASPYPHPTAIPRPPHPAMPNPAASTLASDGRGEGAKGGQWSERPKYLSARASPNSDLDLDATVALKLRPRHAC